MTLRYLGAAVIVLFAGCSASHTANPVNVLPGSPGLSSQGIDPFKLTRSHVIHKYPVPNPYSEPWLIANGPDKSVWFTELNSAWIGKITPSGVITQYAIPSGTYGYDIAAGPHGLVWFTEYGPHHAIGKITATGQITEYLLPPGGYWDEGIAKGPDGNMWFTDQNTNSVGKITRNGTITEYPLPTPGTGVNSITAGPDGNLWFTEQFVGNIGKVTTGGAVTEYKNGSGPVTDIAAGPDGNLYALGGSSVWKVTPLGEITIIPGATGYGGDIILGPDKQMWIAGANYLQEFDPKTQTFSPWINLAPGAGLEGLTLGSDGNVWIASPGGYILVYEEKITTIGIRLNGEMSIIDPNYGFELGYSAGTKSTQTETIDVDMGESVRFQDVDSIPHSAAFLGDATANSASWPASFNGSTIQSPEGTEIGTVGWATGSLNPNKKSPAYETGLPGFYMIGCQYHYNTNEMRTVIVVH